MNKAAPLTPQSLLNLATVSDVQLGQAGQVVYVQTRIDNSGSIPSYQSWLRWAPDGCHARDLTTQWDGMGRGDSSPRFSPCGNWLAFVRQRAEQTPQLMLLDLRQAGEARPLLQPQQQFVNIQQLKWSPNGRFLSFLGHKESGKEGENVVDSSDPSNINNADNTDTAPLSDARLITQLPLRADGYGWIPEQTAPLWCYQLPEQPEQGTAGQLRLWYRHTCNLGAYAWQPDSSGVIVATSADKSAEMQRLQQLFYLPLLADQGELQLEKIHEWQGVVNSILPHSSANGLLLVGTPADKGTPEDAHLFWLFNNEAKRLDHDFDHPLGNLVAGDWQVGAVNPAPVWLTPTGANHNHGDEAICLYTVGGTTGVFAVSLAGKVRPLHHQAQQVVSSFAWHAGELAIIRESASQPPEVEYRGHLLSNTRQALGFEPLKPQRLEHNGVEGWILCTSVHQTAGSVPALLNIHGGPHTAYGHGFMHEFQLLAAQGYAVCYCNPRGSAGYGQAWNDAIFGRWGSIDKDDILGFFEACLASNAQLDSSRTGVMGGSYGGYMTNWIISQHEHFQVAITDRCLSNLLSFAGTSDIGSFFWHDELGLNLAQLTDASQMWEMSPLRYVSQVKTPTLVVHSQADYRCPQEQAEQWYVALYKQQVPTQLLLFPDECHDLSRSGRPDRRMHRLQAYLDWLAKWLS